MAAGDNVDGTTSGAGGDSFLGLWSWEQFRLFLGKFAIALIVVAILIIAARWITKFIARKIRESNVFSDDNYSKKVGGLVADIVFYSLCVFCIFIGFAIIGVDFGWILWGLSFGIGFAFKDILGNMFAGIMVLTNNDYKLGDIIVVDDDDKEYFGRIEEITIRYTVIRTFELRKVIIPNLTMITKPVKTYDTEDVIRLDFTLMIHYDSPMPESLDIIKEAVNNVDIVKEHQSTKVNILSMSNNGIEVLIYFYFDPKSGMLIQTAKGKVQEWIFKALQDHNIKIPYPHTTLTVDHNDKNLIGTALYIAKEGSSGGLNNNGSWGQSPSPLPDQKQ